MRREVRQAINDEVDKGLQGLLGICDFAAIGPEDEQGGGPLSSRLRKRKLNSA